MYAKSADQLSERALIEQEYDLLLILVKINPGSLSVTFIRDLLELIKERNANVLTIA